MQRSIKNIYQDKLNGIAYADTLLQRVAIIVSLILILTQIIIELRVTVIGLSEVMIMIKAFYFALHFAMIFLGVIIAIHVETWIGLAIMGLFTVKFLLMFPDLNERTDI